MRYPLLIGAAATIAALLAAVAPASSAGIDPACKTMTDPRACTCALENGGGVYDDPRRPGHKLWRISRKASAAHAAFMNCSNRSGSR